MGNKKLFFILHNYWGQRQGGAELQAHYLEQAAAQKGWQTHYFFLSDKSEYPPSGNTLLHSVKSQRVWTKLGDITYPYSPQLWQALKQTDPDIIYQRCGMALTGVAAGYAQKYNRKFIFHIASDRDVHPQAASWHKPYLVPERKLTEYGILKADTIIAQTKIQADTLAVNFKKKAIVIPNGHPVPKDCKKNRDEIFILWIGNWKSVKQPEIFIEVARQINHMDQTRLIMLGRTGKYKALVPKARQSKIDVMGEVDNQKVNELLERAHLLINTSDHEGFSNTFIEAWMRRVPVLSLQADPDHLIKKMGIGCCSGSVENLISDTKELIVNHQKREIMGKLAREFASRHLSLDNMNQILEVMHLDHR